MSDTLLYFVIGGLALVVLALVFNMIHLRRERSGVVVAPLDYLGTVDIPEICENYHPSELNTMTHILKTNEEPELEIPGIIPGENTFCTDPNKAFMGIGHWVHLKNPITGRWDFRYAHQLGLSEKELESMKAAMASGNKASLKREILADNQFTQTLAPSKETKTVFRSAKHSEGSE